MPEESKKKKIDVASLLFFWKKFSLTREPDLNVVWLYLLAAFLLVAVAIITLHFILYLRISSNEIFVSEKQETPEVETIDRSKLETLLKDLRQEKARFHELGGR